MFILYVSCYMYAAKQIINKYKLHHQAKNYNSPPTGEALAMQTLTKSRLASPGNGGARRGFVRSCGVGLAMSWCKWILVFIYLFVMCGTQQGRIQELARGGAQTG